MLDHPFWVSMGEHLNVQLMFPSCIVSVNGVDTLADLMLLEMVDFDIISGYGLVVFMPCLGGLLL